MYNQKIGGNLPFLKPFTIVLAFITAILFIKMNKWKQAYLNYIDQQTIRGWNNCLNGISYDADVAFFGHSLIRNGDFNKALPDYKVVNLGVGGNDIPKMLHRISTLRICTPEVVFVMAGINDFRNHKDEEIIGNFSALVDSIHTVPTVKKIVYINMLPINEIVIHEYTDNNHIKLMNKALSDVCIEKKIDYIDAFSLYEEHNQLPLTKTQDGIHITKSSYAPLYDIIETYLKNNLLF